MLAAAAIALLVVPLAGCGAGSSLRQATSGIDLRWPPPPLPPRIEWVKDIQAQGGLRHSKGFWKRLSDILTGDDNVTRIVRPYGIYVDRSDRLFIVDVSLAVVHVMDFKNLDYEIIGGGESKVFYSPVGITGDGENTLYITDSRTGIVYRYDMRDRSLNRFTVFETGRPTGIAYNPANGLLYITDTDAHQVAVFDQGGKQRLRIGGRGDGPGRFNYPTDIFVDDRGQLYVTDSLNGRVQIFSADGAFIGAIGSPGDTPGSFARPKGVAVDSEGHIYVSDALADMVQIFDASGKLLLTFGVNGTNAGEFWMPSGIFIDKQDFIYVADTYNRRVQVFRYLSTDLPHTDEKGKKQ